MLSLGVIVLFSWDTPLGSCSWAGGTVQCSDSSVTPVLSGGNCNLQVTSADYRHSGLWKCKVVPSSKALSGGVEGGTFVSNDDISVDFVNVTISSNCPSTGGLDNNWWRTGWTAGLLWSAVGLLVLIVIIIVIVTIYCFCPVLCLCLPCCGGQREKRQEHRHPHQVPLTTTTIPPVTWTELL